MSDFPYSIRAESLITESCGKMNDEDSDEEEDKNENDDDDGADDG